MRREFFGKIFRTIANKPKKTVPIFPPYFEKNLVGSSVCLDCEGKECLDSCFEDILIFKADALHPEIDFNRGGCTICDDCAKACKKGFLSLENKKEKLDAKIELDILKCLSWQGTVCFSCKDSCFENAIRFFGISRAEIENEKCTNCGACVKVCPSGAIGVKYV